MNRTHLRRIPPARAAVRPSMPDSARGFGALAQTQARPCVGEGRHSYTEKCLQIADDDCFFTAMGEIDRC